MASLQGFGLGVHVSLLCLCAGSAFPASQCFRLAGRHKAYRPEAIFPAVRFRRPGRSPWGKTFPEYVDRKGYRDQDDRSDLGKAGRPGNAVLKYR